MNTFNELTKNQKCLLVGKVSKQLRDGLTVEEIAEKNSKPVEMIEEVVDIINAARENGMK